jgi:hypothetical protein
VVRRDASRPVKRGIICKAILACQSGQRGIRSVIHLLDRQVFTCLSCRGERRLPGSGHASAARRNSRQIGSRPGASSSIGTGSVGGPNWTWLPTWLHSSPLPWPHRRPTPTAGICNELAYNRAARYGYNAVRGEKAERAERLAAQRQRYCQALVDGPVLLLEFPERRLMLNPTPSCHLGDEGNVYADSMLQFMSGEGNRLRTPTGVGPKELAPWCPNRLVP